MQNIEAWLQWSVTRSYLGVLFTSFTFYIFYIFYIYIYFENIDLDSLNNPQTVFTSVYPT